MTEQKSVLVIDDDKVLSGALETKFRGKGYVVVVCENGESAIAAMNVQKFHVILTDLHMPGKDGFAVLEEKAKSQNAQTPAYVITNLGTEQYCDKAMGLGARKCFIKSHVTLRDVVDVVNTEMCA